MVAYQNQISQVFISGYYHRISTWRVTYKRGQGDYQMNAYVTMWLLQCCCTIIEHEVLSFIGIYRSLYLVLIFDASTSIWFFILPYLVGPHSAHFTLKDGPVCFLLDQVLLVDARTLIGFFFLPYLVGPHLVHFTLKHGHGFFIKQKHEKLWENGQSR